MVLFIVFVFVVLSPELLHLICHGCNYSSACELLSGCDEPADLHSSTGLFPRGLLHHILDYLQPKLMKDTWKKSPTAPHAYVWCVRQVKVNLGSVYLK